MHTNNRIIVRMFSLLLLLIISCTPNSVEPPVTDLSEVSFSSEQSGTSSKSLIRYATIELEENGNAHFHEPAHFSHFELAVDAQTNIIEAVSITLSPELDFIPDHVVPSPDGGYLVLMQPVVPGGRPHVFNQKTGEVQALFETYAGGRFFGWHPDARHFLFWIDMVGLWLVDAETGNKLKLAEPAGPVQGAAISPDGQTIAYITNDLPDTVGALWFVDSAGKDARVQFDAGDISYLYSHAWSPDGMQLLYYGNCSAGSGGKNIQVGGPLCVFDTLSQSSQSLELPFVGYEPVWSPNGRYIAGTGLATKTEACQKTIILSESDSCLYNGRSIYLVDMVTGETQELTEGIAPVWSPDGSSLAFLSHRTGVPEVWTISIDGSNLKQLTTDGLAKSPYGQLAWVQEVE